MALRNVVVKGDPILAKKCRVIEKVDDRLKILVEDMIETMKASNGCGIAAPQVGMLKRLCVCMPDPEKPEDLFVLINPEIVESSGEQTGYEGCLSVPDKIGCVTRPEHLVVKSLDLEGDEVEYTFDGFSAVVASHEMDHLDGILYVDKATDIHNPAEDEE